MDWGEDPEGATPLDEEQRAGLRLSWVSTRADLNEPKPTTSSEGQRNSRARVRPRGGRRADPQPGFFDHVTVRRVHRDMFGDVSSSGTGQFRQRDLSVGVEFWRVPGGRISSLLADTCCSGRR